MAEREENISDEDMIFGAIEEAIGAGEEQEQNAEETESADESQKTDDEASDEDADEATQEQEEEDEEADEEESGSEDEAESSDAEPPTLLAGKYASVEELEKAHQEAQRKITELGQANSKSEIEALRKQIEEMQAKKEEPEPEPVYFEDQAPTNMEQLHQLAVSDPDRAAGWAADNAPHYMPHVLATIRTVNPQRAEELTELWYEWKAEQRMAPLMQQQQQHHEETVARQVRDEFLSQHDDWVNFSEEFKEELGKQKGQFDKSDPDSIRRAFQFAYNAAKVRALTIGLVQAEQQGSKAQAKAGDAMGSSSSPPQKKSKAKLTPEEAAAQEIADDFMRLANEETQFHKNFFGR